MSSPRRPKPTLSNRMQMTMYSIIKSPIKTFAAFIVLNIASYAAYKVLNNQKVIDMSYLIKTFSQLKLPLFIRKPLFTLYGSVYNVNFQEIKNPLQSHESFISFFTRQVKQRPITQDINTIISPCDSKILSFGEVTQNYAQVVKGYKYSIGKILTNKDIQMKIDDINNLKQNKDNKLFHVVLYLSPGDYHRFHSPTKFFVDKKRLFGHELYPVYPKFLSSSNKKVYQQNRRVCIIGKSATGYLNYILVGATNVGQIVVHNKKQYQKGQQIGMFKLGSTIVMIFEAPPSLKWQKSEGQKIKFGQPLYKI